MKEHKEIERLQFLVTLQTMMEKARRAEHSSWPARRSAAPSPRQSGVRSPSSADSPGIQDEQRTRARWLVFMIRMSRILIIIHRMFMSTKKSASFLVVWPGEPSQSTDNMVHKKVGCTFMT